MKSQNNYHLQKDPLTKKKEKNANELITNVNDEFYLENKNHV